MPWKSEKTQGGETTRIAQPRIEQRRLQTWDAWTYICKDGDGAEMQKLQSEARCARKGEKMKNIWLEENRCEVEIDKKIYVPTGLKRWIDKSTICKPCGGYYIYEYMEKRTCKPDGHFMVDASGYPQLEIKGEPAHTIIVRLKASCDEEE